MVTSPGEHGVLLIGGYNKSKGQESDLILELNCNIRQELEWFPLKQKLQMARKQHLAFISKHTPQLVAKSFRH